MKRCEFCQIPYVKEECGCFLSRFANSYFGKHNVTKEKDADTLLGKETG